MSEEKKKGDPEVLSVLYGLQEWENLKKSELEQSVTHIEEKLKGKVKTSEKGEEHARGE